MATKEFLLTAVVIVGIAIFLKEDLPPEEFSNPWKLTIQLSLVKTINIIADITEIFGFNPAIILRNSLEFVASYFHPHLDPSVKMKDLDFNGVPVRLYDPDVKGQSGLRRGIMYFHGGGFAIGNLDSYDVVAHRIAFDTGTVVISVDYRKAPEHVFPAAVEDSEKATTYLVQHALEFKVDSNRIGLMGDSAGGNLATVVSIRLRSKMFKPMPKLQVLIYPVVQKITDDLPSYRYNQYGPFVTKTKSTLFISTYLFGYDYLKYRDAILQNAHSSSAIKKFAAENYMDLKKLPNDVFMKEFKQRLDVGNATLWNEIKEKFLSPDLSPLFVKDLSGLPSAYISTCQYDVLRDEGFFYVHRLKEAGVKVEHSHLYACFHGWISANKEFETFDKEFQKIMDFIDENL